MSDAPAVPYWFTPAKAKRLIDHGDAIWNAHPRKRSVVWREGRYFFRLSATNMRLLLEYRPAGRRCWKPSYCRW